MIVITMDNAAPNIRGYLTRWLLEVKPGCFVGEANAIVREQLWEEILQENRSYYTGAIMIYSTNTEQGYDIKMIDNPKRQLADFEGVKLITYKNTDSHVGISIDESKVPHIIDM